MDKAGNFIGWLHMDGANLSVLLVEQALSKVHFTAERSAYYKPLLSAEEAAKQRKEKVPSTDCTSQFLIMCSFLTCSFTHTKGPGVRYHRRHL